MGERAILRLWCEGDGEPFPIVIFTHWGGREDRVKGIVGRAFVRVERDLRETSLAWPFSRAEPDAILPILVAEAVETGVRLFPAPPSVDSDLLATVDHGIYTLHIARTVEGVRWRLTNIPRVGEERELFKWGAITPPRDL